MQFLGNGRNDYPYKSLKPTRSVICSDHTITYLTTSLSFFHASNNYLIKKQCKLLSIIIQHSIMLSLSPRFYHKIWASMFIKHFFPRYVPYHLSQYFDAFFVLYFNLFNLHTHLKQLTLSLPPFYLWFTFDLKTVAQNFLVLDIHLTLKNWPIL